jgi:CheY-like chemotaxis protein
MTDTTEKIILVVDDQAHMRRLLAYAMRGLGARVVMVGSGAEAVAQAAAGRVDLLLVDVVMPEMDGFETVRAIKARPEHAQLPVIMLTARGQQETRDAAAILGVNRFLTKPFSPAELAVEAGKLLQL